MVVGDAAARVRPGTTVEWPPAAPSPAALLPSSFSSHSLIAFCLFLFVTPLVLRLFCSVKSGSSKRCGAGRPTEKCGSLPLSAGRDACGPPGALEDGAVHATVSTCGSPAHPLHVRRPAVTYDPPTPHAAARTRRRSYGCMAPLRLVANEYNSWASPFSQPMGYVGEVSEVGRYGE